MHLKKILLFFVMLIIPTSLSLAGRGVYLSGFYGFGKTYGDLASSYQAGTGDALSIGYRFNKLIALEAGIFGMKQEPDSAQDIMVDYGYYRAIFINFKLYPVTVGQKILPFISVGFGDGFFYWNYNFTYTDNYRIENEYLDADPLNVGLGIDYEISSRLSLGTNFRYFINFFDSRSHRLNQFVDGGNTTYFSGHLTFYCSGCK